MTEHWNSDRIRRLRAALGWSQEQLARAVGYSNRVTACLWEQGKRRPVGPAVILLDRLETKARRQGLLI